MTPKSLRQGGKATHVKRGVCPSCNAKRAVIFAEHLFNDVLAQVPHRHVVFTIPKRLRSFGRYDRDTLGHLFSAASGAVAEVRSGPHGIPGLVLTAQTAGDALNWNPHLHGLLADGLFNPDGSFAPFKLLDEAALLRRFSELCVANFLNQELITESVAAQILSQEHSGFSVWLGEPFKDEESAKFVARYIERGPLALERLSATENTVLYTTKTGEIHRYDPLDFLALLTAQIPKPYESICRYYGWYSCRSRGERKKAATVEPVVSQLPEEPLPATPSSRWAACIKRVYEIDPLECPKCKATMRVISFITDPHALAKIMKSLGVPQPKNPAPMAQSPPAEQELFDDGPQYW